MVVGNRIRTGAASVIDRIVRKTGYRGCRCNGVYHSAVSSGRAAIECRTHCKGCTLRWSGEASRRYEAGGNIPSSQNNIIGSGPIRYCYRITHYRSQRQAHLRMQRG